MQYKFSPIALCNKTPATVESTPPDNPKTTLSFPILAFNSATVLSTKESGVQSCENPQILTTKFFNKIAPSLEW